MDNRSLVLGLGFAQFLSQDPAQLPSSLVPCSVNVNYFGSPEPWSISASSSHLLRSPLSLSSASLCGSRQEAGSPWDLPSMLPMSQGHDPVLPVTQCLKIVDLYILFSFLVFFSPQHKDKLNAVFCVMARSRRQAGAMTIMVLKQGLPTVVAQWNPLRNFLFQFWSPRLCFYMLSRT